MEDITKSYIMPIIATTAVLALVFVCGAIFAFNFEEPVTRYEETDMNRDGVTDVSDFSIAVDKLGKIMDVLGAEETPCITECPQGFYEVAPYEPEMSSVPLPFGGAITNVTVTE